MLAKGFKILSKCNIPESDCTLLHHHGRRCWTHPMTGWWIVEKAPPLRESHAEKKTRNKFCMQWWRDWPEWKKIEFWTLDMWHEDRDLKPTSQHHLVIKTPIKSKSNATSSNCVLFTVHFWSYHKIPHTININAFSRLN